MSFWEKIKQSLRTFMNGRNGSDKLSTALLWAGLGCYLLGSVITSIQNPVAGALGTVLTLAGFAAYLFSVYRMFSRNLEKRREENRRYERKLHQVQTRRKQAVTRFKNRKQYKYFKCPGCKAWLRLPRGTGVVTVTCSRCHNSFTQKG